MDRNGYTSYEMMLIQISQFEINQNIPMRCLAVNRHRELDYPLLRKAIKEGYIEKLSHGRCKILKHWIEEN